MANEDLLSFGLGGAAGRRSRFEMVGGSGIQAYGL
jgi:hypothetical protein